MKTMILLMALAFGTVLATTGCAEEPTKPEPLQTAETVGKTDFAFELFRAVAKEKPNENISFSPLGAERALGLVRAGAAGDTKTQIDAILGDKALGDPVPCEMEVGSPLTLAASIWTQAGHPILPEFLKTAREEFGATAEQADFSADPAEAVRRINAWCAEKTRQKIPTLFEKLDATTRCVLAGAVYFAADWKTKFEEEATAEGTFTLADGTKTKTPMMSRTGLMKYAEAEDALLLELPYKNNGYAMVLLLPTEPEGFKQLESALSAEKLAGWRASAIECQIDLRLPLFTTESELALNEPLQTLGMPTAFGRDADFSKIDGRKDLYLSEVRQKVYVKVDEAGTEAAAATGTVISVKSARLDVKPFYANRPFLYAILKENAVLFLGCFVKPAGEKPFVDPGLSGEGGEFN